MTVDRIDPEPSGESAVCEDCGHERRFHAGGTSPCEYHKDIDYPVCDCNGFACKTPRRIDPVLVEKVDRAYYVGRALWHEDEPDAHMRGMKAAIQAVFDELRLKEEHRERRAGYGDLFGPEKRLVSDWRPVEQGDTK